MANNVYRLKRLIDGRPAGTVFARLNELSPTPTPTPPDVPTSTNPEKIARSLGYRIPSGYPRFETVGIPDGVTLVELAGDQLYTTDTTVTEKLITGSVTAKGCTVTLNRCRIVDTGDRKLTTSEGATDDLSTTGYIVADQCEIDGNYGAGGVGVGFSNITLKRSWIHHCVDGFRVANNCLVEDCLISDSVDNPNANHVDCMQTNAGRNSTVRHNTLLSWRHTGSYGNAAMGIGCEEGPLTNFTFEGNFLDGGNYAMFVKNPNRNDNVATIRYDMTNLVIRNNVFGTNNRYGHISMREVALLTDKPKVSIKGSRNVEFYSNAVVETRPDVTSDADQQFRVLAYADIGSKAGGTSVRSQDAIGLDANQNAAFHLLSPLTIGADGEAAPSLAAPVWLGNSGSGTLAAALGFSTVDGGNAALGLLLTDTSSPDASGKIFRSRVKTAGEGYRAMNEMRLVAGGSFPRRSLKAEWFFRVTTRGSIEAAGVTKLGYGFAGGPTNATEAQLSLTGAKLANSWSVRPNFVKAGQLASGSGQGMAAHLFVEYANGAAVPAGGLQVPYVETDGTVFDPTAQLDKNRGAWHRHRMELTINTPGSNNGVLRIWVNGVSLVNLTDVRFSPTGQDVLITHLLAHAFSSDTLNNAATVDLTLSPALYA